jgi:fermentation-respiration switch protein FrsA (DUF1100 family)
LEKSGKFEEGERGQSMQKFRRWLKIVLGSIAVAYLIMVVMLMFLEESMIFFPAKYPAGVWKPSGLPFEDANFQADDGTKLHGWYVPHENPTATILFLHGNAGNITDRVYTLERLHEVVGASVLILDYRGYGRSSGTPSEKGVLADARAARAWLAKKENLPESEIVMMGESLGGGVAVDLAATDGARALVLISTFSSLPDVGAYHYPLFPVQFLMHTRLNSASKIPNYHGPLLQFHGRDDTIVPFRFGKKLFDAANEPKELVISDRHDHNDYVPTSFYERLKTFLEEVSAQKTP